MGNLEHRQEPEKSQLTAAALRRYKRSVEAFNQLASAANNDYLVFEMAAAQKVFCHVCSLFKVV